MSTLYKIISEGYPVEGQAKKEVIERIAQRFKMDIAKAGRLVSGKAVALKSGLDHSTMTKYSKILESTGLKFKVESSDADAPIVHRGNSATRSACPKCGHETHADINDPQASCGRCGVLFNKVAAKEKGRDAYRQAADKDIRPGNGDRSNPRQEGSVKIRDRYDTLPGSLKNFWRLMIVVSAIALLRAIFEGGAGLILGVALGVGVAWFYIPYYCMRIKGYWPWVFTVVWTFPFGLVLLSESAKAYFLSEDI